LAPHCDDVEIFVLQLEGKKEWKLYKPMVELSRDYTQDLLQESIGEPMMEVLMEPGDLLYFPRGTIHQAKTVGSGHSTHISISTYQQNTWGDFMNHAVTQAIENALEDDVTIRSGLPINYLSMLGTGRNINQYIEDEDGEKSDKHSNLNQDKVKEFKKNIKSHLSKLIDHIDVNTAADAMCADFMSSRLPPFGYTPKEDVEEEEEVIPTLDDKIRIRYPEHVRIVYADEEENEDDEIDSDEEMEEDDEKPAKKDKEAKLKSPKSAKKKAQGEVEDDDDDDDADVGEVEPHIKVIHSFDNNRFSHMGPEAFDEEPGCAKLDVSFAKAMVELLACKDYIAVKDLILDEDDDKITMATTLVANDLVELKSS